MSAALRPVVRAAADIAALLPPARLYCMGCDREQPRDLIAQTRPRVICKTCAARRAARIAHTRARR